jgi:hypothetical protein
VALAQIPWCDQPAVSFQDGGKVSNPAVADWSAVKGQLGFTPYLPPTMPKGTCLALAGGSIHDPVFGGRFLITYYLPSTGPLSFSEAPKNSGAEGKLSDKVQCSQAAQSATPPATPTATPAQPLTICLGTISGTSVSVASALSGSELERIFGKLQPNQDWVPRQSAAPAATPTTAP